MEITRFDQEEQREIREIVGGTAIEDMPEVQSFTDKDLVPFIKVTGGNDNPVKSAAVIKATRIGGGGSGGAVTGVKGHEEDDYRVGDVDITKENIGLGNVDNKSATTLKNEIMTATNVKNVLGCQDGGTKYLKEDGSWDIPAGGGGGTGTVTGAKVGSGSAIEPDANGIINLPNYETDAQKNVKPDWNAVSGSAAEILNKPTIPEGVEPSSSTPLEATDNGAVGTDTKFARGDHRHPHDSTKADKTSTVSAVQYRSDTKKLTKTINGAETDVVTISTLKSEMGLDNVTNDSQVKRSEMGVANGVATLDNDGKVPSSQLPSYVDDVIDLLDVTGTAPSTCAKGDRYYNTSSNKIFTATAANTWSATGETPEGSKIYVNLANGKTYRWSGTTLAVISETLALGETSSTAYRGDRGKTAYDHSQSTHARTDATKVEGSSTNGNIKINGTETTVYTHQPPTNAEVVAALGYTPPQKDTNTTYQFQQDGNTLKMGTDGGTKSNIYTPSFSAPVTSVAGKTGAVQLNKNDVDLGNVGNFLAVSTAANQGLDATKKANARTNIGAGTSSFSGNYNDLANKPTIPTVPTNVSAFTNDAGYLTQHQDISGKADKSDTYTKSEVDGDITQLRSELNAKQLQVGAVPTDNEPTKNSANRLTSGTLYEQSSELITTASFSFTRRHLAGNDRIYVNIKKGTVFSLYVQGSSTDFSDFYLYLNESEMPGNFKDQIGKTFKVTAPVDVEFIGMWLQNTTTVNQSMYVEIRVFASNNAISNMEVRKYIERQAGFTKTFQILNGDYFRERRLYIGDVVKGMSYRITIETDTGITFVTPPSGSPNADFWYMVCLFDSIENGTNKQVVLSRTKDLGGFKKDVQYFIANDSGPIGFRYLRIADGERVTITLTPDNYINNSVEDDFDRVMALQSRRDSYGASSERWYPAFLAISDIHSSWDALDRAFEYSTNYCIDAVLLLGDLCEGSGQLSSYDLDERRLNIDKPSLAIPGNHEFEYTTSDPTVYVGMTDSEVRSYYYNSAMIERSGENHPTTGGFKNYFYKDITKNGNTVRLIGLYQFEWNPSSSAKNDKEVPFYTQAQIDWLVQTLKDTPSSYGVIILSHAEISKCSPIESAFTEHTLSVGPYSYLSNETFFCSIIDAWVNRTSCNVESNQITPTGGSDNHKISVNTSFSRSDSSKGLFFGNLCGHRHSGGLFKMVDSSGNVTKYPVAMSPCTTDKDYQQTGWWNRHVQNGRTRNCLNAYVCDFDHKKLKIARIGSFINAEGQEAKTYVIQL